MADEAALVSWTALRRKRLKFGHLFGMMWVG